MMDVTKATPPPWEVSNSAAHDRKMAAGQTIWADGMMVAQVAGLGRFDFANAKLIVTAVNMHDRLVAFLDKDIDACRVKSCVSWCYTCPKSIAGECSKIRLLKEAGGGK